MHKLDPDRTRDLVEEVLEQGSKEVKLAAIACLGGREDAVDYLLEQAQGRNKEIRQAAFRSIASIDEPRAVELLQEALQGKELDLVAPYVNRNKNEGLASFVVEELERQLELLLNPPKTKAAGAKAKASKKGAAAKKSTAKKTTAKDDRSERAVGFYYLLSALRGRSDKAAQKFLLKCFSMNMELVKLKGLGWVDGDSIVARVTHLLLETGSKAALKAVADAGTEMAPNIIGSGFVANCRVRSPKEVYELFAPAYLARPKGNTKPDKLTKAKAEQIAHVLASRGELEEDEEEDTYDYEIFEHDPATAVLRKTDKLDPRWLDAAISVDDISVVLALANKGSAKLNAYLSGKVEADLKKRTWDPDYQLTQVLQVMIRIQHPQLVPLFVEVMRRAGKKPRYWWESYYLVRIVGELPAKAIKPLEELVSDMHENMLNTFVDQLDELKQKHES